MTLGRRGINVMQSNSDLTPYERFQRTPLNAVDRVSKGECGGETLFD